ncbi:hypothetical protein B296_00012745 [Ensete ventricosum]|uniref:Uncharacterized protein n=1 Tax=Ensete ventricosum TaxID=4639 RepID=A0A427B4L5_ENSVE|nr:hypothetical protein B296_00012745 [Ensete ventricosum]
MSEQRGRKEAEDGREKEEKGDRRSEAKKTEKETKRKRRAATEAMALVLAMGDPLHHRVPWMAELGEAQ